MFCFFHFDSEIHYIKSRSKGKYIAVREGTTPLREIMPWDHTVLPPGSGDFPAFTLAEAGTRFSDPRGMQGWVDLDGGYIPR